MKLAGLKNDWRQDITFMYKLGLFEYQCKVKYLPFSNKNRNGYETKKLSEINTPVFHFEFEALNAKETFYQSYWIMPYALVRFLDICPDSPLDEMVQFAEKEDSFTERITTAYRELSRGTQLSIF